MVKKSSWLVDKRLLERNSICGLLKKMPFSRKTKEKIQSQINSFIASLNSINKKLDDMSFFVAEIELLRLKIDNLENSNKNLTAQNKKILDLLATLSTAEQLADFAKESSERLSKLSTSQEVSELFEKTSSEIAEFSARTANSISKLASAETISAFSKTTEESLSKLSTLDALQNIFEQTSESISKLASADSLDDFAKNTQKTLSDISEYNVSQFARLATSQELKDFAETTGDALSKLATTQAISEFEQKTSEHFAKLATAEELAKLPTSEQLSAFEQKSTETLARLATSQEVKDFAETTGDTLSKLATTQAISEFSENAKSSLEKLLQSEVYKTNFAEIVAKTRQVWGNSFEAVWAEVFHDAIKDCAWLKNTKFYPGRWAVGYPALYAIFRILENVKPQNILELGLGQSTRMIGQYAMQNKNITHTLIESSSEWVTFFKNEFELPSNTEIQILECEIKDFNGHQVRQYKDFDKIISGKKFDFICIDAPLGGDMKDFARVDVAKNIPGILKDNFIILLDDCNRSGEHNTLEFMKTTLQNAGVAFVQGRVYGQKTTEFLCSPQYNYITSI